VSATETPAPPTEQPAQRRCPRCGNDLAPDQEWCLNCGADVGSTFAPPPRWRGPVALVIALLAVAAAALILALVELAGDAEQVTEQPAGQTPTPAASVAPSATSTASPVTIPPATDNGSAGSTPEIADWPDGKDAWTVVLEASATQTAAESRAKELSQQGVPVGILDSNLFSSLQADRFVVFSGQYDTKRAADQALQDVSSEVTGGYVRHIIPKAGASPSASPSTSPQPQP
jgi:hypothetical protein